MSKCGFRYKTPSLRKWKRKFLIGRSIPHEVLLQYPNFSEWLSGMNVKYLVSCDSYIRQ